MIFPCEFPCVKGHPSFPDISGSIFSSEVQAMAMPLPVQTLHRSWWTTPGALQTDTTPNSSSDTSWYNTYNYNSEKSKLFRRHILHNFFILLFVNRAGRIGNALTRRKAHRMKNHLLHRFSQLPGVTSEVTTNPVTDIETTNVGCRMMPACNRMSPLVTVSYG